MIWADRVGLGRWAICVVALTVLLFAGFFGPLVPPERSNNPYDAFDDLDKAKPSFAFPSDQFTDGQVGIGPPKTGLRIAGEAAIRMTVFVALPIWLVLRIVDFMLGGPMRRRRSRRAIAERLYSEP